MKEINVVITDKKIEVAEKLKKVLENIGEIIDIKIITNENKIYNELIKTKTDILFLDSSIRDGRKIVERIADEKKNYIPYLIYTDTEPTQPTNNKLFSKKELGALIKPYIDEEITRSVEIFLLKDNKAIINKELYKKLLKLSNFNKI